MSSDDNNKTCKDCNEAKPLDAFETTTKDGKCRRAVCRPCWNARRALKAKEASKKHDPSATPKPGACIKCGKGPGEVDFKWRADVQRGGWRPECNSCINEKGYAAEYRKRERAKDERAFLERNARVKREWMHNKRNGE